MPGHVVQPRKASVSLQVLIVGGNIAGLSAAFALQAAGHQVTVLEQAPCLQKSYGAVRSPPNLTRLLTYWGLDPLLRKQALDCSRFAWREGETGDFLGYFHLHEEFMKALLANFTFVQHGDLVSMIHDIATREGANVLFNSKVVSVQDEPLSVTLENGQTLRGDLIVGADGPSGIMRQKIAKDPTSSYAPYLVLSMGMPSDVLVEDPELKHYAESDDWSLWLGSGYMVRANLVCGKQQFFMSLTLPHGITPSQAKEYGEVWDWNKPYKLEDFDLSNYKFEPVLQKLMSKVTHITPTTVVRRPPLESLVCESGTCVLIGQAAHPLTPDAMHGASMSVEDAECLGNLFSRLHHKDEVPRLLSTFEELRLQRTSEVQEYEPRKVDMLTLPEGPQRQARDEKLRASTAVDQWEHMDEASFKAMWGEELSFFVYDAAESVEDWWTKWGSFMSPHQIERRLSAAVPPVTPTVQISVKEE